MTHLCLQQLVSFVRLVDTRIRIFFKTYAQIWIFFKTYVDFLPRNIFSFHKICHNPIPDANVNTRQRCNCFYKLLPLSLARNFYTLSCYKNVVKRCLYIPEALRATNNICIRQYLRINVRLLKKNLSNESPVVTVVTNQEDKDVKTLQTEASVSSEDSGSTGDSGLNQWRKYVRGNNIEQVIEKPNNIDIEAKFNAGLKDSFELLGYVSAIKNKTAQNKNYIE